MSIELTREQLPPSAAEATSALRALLDIAAYPDIDHSTDAGAEMLLARWQIAEAAIQKLEQTTGELLECLREQTRIIDQFLSGNLVVFPSAIRHQAKSAIARAEGRE